jgi:DNA gyrase subunit B
MSYDANSIQVRDFRTACRSTPGMYLGATAQDAAFNCFLEVLNNACDEAMMGRGNKIEITLSDDCNTLMCVDSGAGVPRGPNKDCEEVLIELFSSAHSSGKFDTINYKKVRGCHGIGTSAVCVCSSIFEVWSRREGAEYYLKFNDGIPASPKSQKVRDILTTGSTFRFTPNKEVLNIEKDQPAFQCERIREELRLTSYFIPKVYFVFTYKGKSETFYSLNGLKDFAKDNISKPLHKSYIYGYKEFDDEVEVEVFAQWTSGKETEYIFSNGALNIDGGTPSTGAKTAFTRTINSLSKGDYNADMIRKGLVYIVNVRHPHPIYQNQTKSRIQNPELRGYTQIVFTEAIKEFVRKHKDEFDKVVELLAKEKKAEMMAERARQQVLNASKEVEKNQKRKVFSSDKLKDAEFLGEDSTLLIAEGDSALGGLAQGRDYTKYGIMAIRGKIINALSNPDEKVYENEEIKLLLSAMNIVPEKYDAKKLRYGKLAICTDADSDGYHIGLLIMAALAHIAPQFIREGRLCWLRSPLWIVNNGKTESYFFTDAEYEANKTKVKGEVQRNKGLGSLEPNQARKSMFDPEYQRMDVIEYDEEAMDLLYSLMGSEVSPRRDFIIQNVDFSEIRE